jgi:hypothetical protein
LFEFKYFSDFILPAGNYGGVTCFNPSPDDLISVPHSNAFIDLDGDCMADIFV